jgi:hypothetical protein
MALLLTASANRKLIYSKATAIKTHTPTRLSSRKSHRKGRGRRVGLETLQAEDEVQTDSAGADTCVSPTHEAHRLGLEQGKESLAESI